MRVGTKLLTLTLTGSLGLAPVLAGCDSLPGNKETQGAVIGGVGGAAAGALIAKNNRLLGGLIGGAVGAGGGYLIGLGIDKNDQKHKDEAIRASENARANPASSSAVRMNDPNQSADLNNDGYVTLDEVAAMRQAGLSDQDMVRRLHMTNQVFDLSSEQQQWLRDRGVDNSVITAMLSMAPPPTASAGPDMGSQPIGQPR